MISLSFCVFVFCEYYSSLTFLRHIDLFIFLIKHCKVSFMRDNVCSPCFPSSTPLPCVLLPSAAGSRCKNLGGKKRERQRLTSRDLIFAEVKINILTQRAWPEVIKRPRSWKTPPVLSHAVFGQIVVLLKKNLLTFSLSSAARESFCGLLWSRGRVNVHEIDKRAAPLGAQSYLPLRTWLPWKLSALHSAYREREPPCCPQDKKGGIICFSFKSEGHPFFSTCLPTAPFEKIFGSWGEK